MVALEALREESTSAAFWVKHKVHPSRITEYKQQLIEDAASGLRGVSVAPVAQIEEVPLQTKIG
jgi:hypothetical protein